MKKWIWMLIGASPFGLMASDLSFKIKNANREDSKNQVVQLTKEDLALLIRRAAEAGAQNQVFDDRRQLEDLIEDVAAIDGINIREVDFETSASGTQGW